jgi:tetratricopeptide (TPR) repeat protein
MSEEDIRRMVEEATKEAMKQSFTEAGHKFLEAARASEQKGDYQGTENLQRQAAENFWKAANEYRSSKSFKAASLNVCLAGDVYSELADVENALRAYEQGANDLFSASTEHLMWGEDAETKKGTALAIAGSMILLMIGKESEGFARARQFSAENASKLRFPGVVRLSQIPQMLESAINAMDLNAFADAETAAVTELKAALASAKAQEFSSYVDKGVEMVREILRGKLKVPKLASQLELPIDMTFKEDFEIKAIIENKGDGPASKVMVEWSLDEGLKPVSGEARINVGTIPAHETRLLSIRARSAQDMMGAKEFSVVLRGTYSDDLKTEYSLQAGPGAFILKDFKETEKLLQDVDVTEGRVSFLYPAIDSSKLEGEPLLQVVSTLESSLSAARNEISKKDLALAKARISTVNALVDTIDSLLGNEELQSRMLSKREAEKKEYARSILEFLKTSFSDTFDITIESLKNENEVLLSQLDDTERKKKGALNKIGEIKEKVSDAIRSIEIASNSIPAASSMDTPQLAEIRTTTRSLLDQLKSTVIALRYDIESVAAESALAATPRPMEHPQITKEKSLLASTRDSLLQSIEDKLNS